MEERERVDYGKLFVFSFAWKRQREKCGINDFDNSILIWNCFELSQRWYFV